MSPLASLLCLLWLVCLASSSKVRCAHYTKVSKQVYDDAQVWESFIEQPGSLCTSDTFCMIVSWHRNVIPENKPSCY